MITISQLAVDRIADVALQHDRAARAPVPMHARSIECGRRAESPRLAVVHSQLARIAMFSMRTKL